MGKAARGKAGTPGKSAQRARVIPLLLAPRDADEQRALDAARGGSAAHDRATLIAQVIGAGAAAIVLVAIFVTG